METYYYEVIGNFGNDGEENGTNYKTLADAKKRINEQVTNMHIAPFKRQMMI